MTSYKINLKRNMYCLRRRKCSTNWSSISQSQLHVYSLSDSSKLLPLMKRKHSAMFLLLTLNSDYYYFRSLMFSDCMNVWLFCVIVHSRGKHMIKRINSSLHFLHSLSTCEMVAWIQGYLAWLQLLKTHHWCKTIYLIMVLSSFSMSIII